MNRENYLEAKIRFHGTEFLEELEDKAVVWSVPDNYNYMDEGLVYIIESDVKDIKKLR